MSQDCPSSYQAIGFFFFKPVLSAAKEKQDLTISKNTLLSVLLWELDSALIQFIEVKLSRKDVTGRKRERCAAQSSSLIVFPFSPVFSLARAFFPSGSGLC